jgi:transcription-repair coupling factor (superfamily II helicase)
MHEELFEKLADNLEIKQVRQTNNFIEITIPKELANNLDGEKLFFEIVSISKMFRFGYRGNQLLIILDIVKLDKHYIYYLIDLMHVIEKCKKNDI